MAKKTAFALPTLAIAAVALSGCNLTGGNDLAQLIVDTVGEMETLQTETTTMPSSGSATYTGAVTGFTADTTFANDVRFLAGEATMEATFTAGGGEVSGTLANFVAKDNVDRTALNNAINAQDVDAVEEILGDFDTVDGEIAIGDGVITDDKYVADVSGELTHGSDTIAVAGAGNGYFSGAGAEGVKFYTDSDLEGGADFTVNGTSSAGMLYVNATE